MMRKSILEQYDDIKREYEDTERRIQHNLKELEKFDNKYLVQDSVNGGMGGTQHFKIEGFPYPEYQEKKTLLLKRQFRLENLKQKLDIALDEVEVYIDTIEDSRKRLIMRLRYVDNKEWSEVAKSLGPGNTADAVRMEITRFLEKVKDE